MAQGTKRRSLPYMPGLDGLRAVSVLAVLLYHADLAWMAGGYLGVEVFFVISGYLIASLLLAEWDDNGALDLKRFWVRRARRLLPALYVLLAVTVAYVALRLPRELADLTGDVAAALTYVTNWYLIWQQESYFEVMGRPSPLQHLWSLAVEEQFYIVWPVLMLLGLRGLRRRGFFAAVCLGVVASAAWMWFLYEPGSDPSRVYYGTDTRAAGLLAGAALAFLWNPWRLPDAGSRGRRLAIDAVGLAALAVVVTMFAVVDDRQSLLFRGGFLVLDLVTLALIAASVHPAGRIGRVLGVAPMRWIGLRSYGIYLWHWPVFMVTRPWVDVAFDGPALLVYRFALSFLLADVSYRLVEQPLRHGDLRRFGSVLRAPHAAAARLVADRRGALAAAGTLAAAAVLAMPLVGFSPWAIERTADASEADVRSMPESVVLGATARSRGGGGVRADALPSPTDMRPDRDDRVPTADVPTRRIPSREPERGAVDPTPRETPSGPTATPTARRAPPAPTGPSVLPAERMREALRGSLVSERGTATARGDLRPTPVALLDPEELSPPPGRPDRDTGFAITETLRTTFIGDSVMLGAATTLQQVFGPSALVDATVSRQFYTGIDTVRDYRLAGMLGDVVVIHLGNNGNLNGDQFDDMMRELAGVRHVFFVTVKVPRRWEQSVNEAVSAGVSRWPGARLVDWRAASYQRPELFIDDGIHLRQPGRELYAGLILEAIRAAVE